jgi:hypothetical protein
LLQGRGIKELQSRLAVGHQGRCALEQKFIAAGLVLLLPLLLSPLTQARQGTVLLRRLHGALQVRRVGSGQVLCLLTRGCGSHISLLLSVLPPALLLHEGCCGAAGGTAAARSTAATVVSWLLLLLLLRDWPLLHARM